MRTANLSGRLVLITDGNTAVDVEQAGDGRFGTDPQSVYSRWPQPRAWSSPWA